MRLLKGSGESVSEFWKSLDKLRAVRVIVQRLAYLLNSRVDSVLEFHKSAIRPQGLLNLGAGHQLSRPAGQEAQQPGRLPLQPDGLSVFMQFACGQVEFESFEANFLILLKLSHLRQLYIKVICSSERFQRLFRTFRDVLPPVHCCSEPSPACWPHDYKNLQLGNTAAAESAGAF